MNRKICWVFFMKEEKAVRMEENGRKQKRSVKKANLLETSNEGSVPRPKRGSEKTGSYSRASL